jgi:hypothetical protein
MSDEMNTQGVLSPHNPVAMDELHNALNEYFEIESEIKAIEYTKAEVRARIEILAKDLGGKAKIDHVGSVQVVPAGVTVLYDGDALDKLVQELSVDGEKEKIAIAMRIMLCKKEKPRKESLRIVGAK